jgi:hypothetical protein
MLVEQLRPGMLVEYHANQAEVLEVDQEYNRVLLRREKDNMQFTVDCNELVEDPQLHVDSLGYY